MRSRRFPSLPRIIITLALPAALTPAAAAVTYADGDFSPINWSSGYSANYGNGGSFTAAQSTGGNPGFKYRVHHSLADADPGEDSGLAVLHTLTAFTHDPATDGPIKHINASLDADRISGNQRVRIAVIQGATLYISTASFTTGSLPLSGWNTVPLGALDAETFAERFPDLTLDTSSHPDFSTAGAPITFGFETSNSTGIGFAGYTTTVDFDNFIIAIVPPPPCPGDIDGDDDTDVFDFSLFASAFGSMLADASFNPDADLNGDDAVDVFDFAIFAADFGCPD